MMNWLKNFRQERNIRAIFKRTYSPSEKEQESAYKAFMQEVHSNISPASITPSYYSRNRSRILLVTRYAFIIVASVLALNTGALIYANVNDVPATHPLYNYKLLAEEIELKTAPKAEQPNLEIKFAARRIHELEELTKDNGMQVSGTTTLSISTEKQDQENSDQNKKSDSDEKNKENSRQKMINEIKDNLRKNIHNADKILQQEDQVNFSNSLSTSTPRVKKQPSDCAAFNNIQKISTLLQGDERDTEISEELSNICSGTVLTNSQTHNSEERNSNDNKQENRHENKDQDQNSTLNSNININTNIRARTETGHKNSNRD